MTFSAIVGILYTCTVCTADCRSVQSPGSCHNAILDMKPRPKHKQTNVQHAKCGKLLLILASVVGLPLASQQLNPARVPPLGPTSLGKPPCLEGNWGELSLRAWQPRQCRGQLYSPRPSEPNSTWGEDLPFFKPLRPFWKPVLQSSNCTLVLSSSGIFWKLLDYSRLF